MKAILSILIAVALFLGTSTCFAESIISESDYLNLMNLEIKKCDILSSKVDCKCEAVRDKAACSCLKAAFYRAFKQDLLAEMVAMGVPAKRHTVHHFMIRAFRDRFESAVPELLARQLD